MHIFISHSSKDAAFADEVCRILEGAGHTCFIAPRDIAPGKEYAEEIMNGIAEAEVMLLLLSREANQSQHVFREVERAVSGGIPILVYKMAEFELKKSLSYFLMVNQWIDGTKDRNPVKILDAVNGKMTGKGNIPNTVNAVSTVKNVKKRPVKLFGTIAACVVILIIMSILWRQVYDERHENVREAEKTFQLLPGDKISLGTYNGEPIEWQVLKLWEDQSLAILVSEKILTMKCFDAAESGTYNLYKGEDYWTKAPEPSDAAFIRGSNIWSDSNIRTWLNSDRNVVVYEDMAPEASAMSEKKNGYSNEPGFLYGFSEDEKAVLCEREIITQGNILTDLSSISTEDKVFLLSENELEWFSEADINIYSVPTKAAVEKDKTKWYEMYSLSLGVEEYIWLLRDPADDSASACKAVTNGYGDEKMTSVEAGTEGFGIRPAICVDYSKLSALSERENR